MKNRNKNILFIINILVILLLAMGFGYELQKAQTITKSKEQWKMLLDHIGIAIVAVDCNGTITIWNNGAEDLLGWKMEEVLGKNLEIFFTDKDYNKKHRDGFNNPHLRNKLNNGEIIEASGYLLHKSGKTIAVRVTIRAIINGHTTYVANMVENSKITYVKP